MERIGVTIGEDVTIVVNVKGPALRQAVVTYTRHRFFSARYHGHLVVDRISLLREGSDWCRGHSGPEVDALAAAQALR